MKYGLWRDEFRGLELPKHGVSRLAGVVWVAVCCLVGLIFWMAVFGLAFEVVR